ncbi:cation-transporting P-type ATPase [Mesorhizobium australicum]|uniref:P-type ATPase n=1 Tax=Mesorhizobium australicum TaxID=536018 RepID=UPI00059B0D3B|nr:cation-transporting P-type ATPase [Mesorhizobium australicum]
MRDQSERSVDAQDIVPGDIIRLSAGNLIPADGVLLETCEFKCQRGCAHRRDVSGGEDTWPVGAVAQRWNAVFTGTSVRSGTATMLVTNTGSHTEFASIAAALEKGFDIRKSDGSLDPSGPRPERCMR